jgi:hypothetical protein
MKKLSLAIVCLACVVVCIPAPVACQGTGNVNAFLGMKVLDEDDWEPVEEHVEIGILFDARPINWPISIAGGLLYSEGEETEMDIKLEGNTLEFDVGVKKIFENASIVRPFLAGGAAFIQAETEGSVFGIFDFGDDTDAIGLWVSGGAYLTLSEHFNLGLDIRWSKAEADWYREDIELGGFHAGLLLGYHW